MVYSSYYKLMKYLQEKDQDMLRITFREIEDVLGAKLPPSAYEHRAWWANSQSHSHARHGWIKAGFETSMVDLGAQEVSFVRAQEAAASFSHPAMSYMQPAPARRSRSIRPPRSGTDDLVRLAGGADNLAEILGAVQAYIDGDLLETELGRDLRRLWPRR